MIAFVLGASFIAVIVWLGPALLLAWALVRRAERNDVEAVALALIEPGFEAQRRSELDALLHALREYAASGGNVAHVAGYEAQRHPSGAYFVELVTRETLAAEAQALLQERGA